MRAVQLAKDYRWGGYAKTVAGNSEAQGDLVTCLGVAKEAVLTEYREGLFGQGVISGPAK